MKISNGINDLGYQFGIFSPVVTMKPETTGEKMETSFLKRHCINMARNMLIKARKTQSTALRECYVKEARKYRKESKICA